MPNSERITYFEEGRKRFRDKLLVEVMLGSPGLPPEKVSAIVEQRMAGRLNDADQRLCNEAIADLNLNWSPKMLGDWIGCKLARHRLSSEIAAKTKASPSDLLEQYRQAHQHACNIRQRTPNLLALPASDADPIIGLHNLQQWCESVKARADLLAGNLDRWAENLIGPAGDEWKWSYCSVSFDSCFDDRVTALVNRPGDAMTRRRLERIWKKAKAAVERVDEECTAPALLSKAKSKREDALMAAEDAMQDARRIVREVARLIRDGFTAATGEAATKLQNTANAAGQGAGGKSKGRKRRQTRPKKLTSRQVLALELYSQHNGDISAVANAMQRNRSTVHQHLKAAWRKAPDYAPKKGKSPRRASKLPTDSRGQEQISDGSRCW